MDLVKQMNAVLANTYALYLKTQKYHWNVKGVHFASLHVFLEGQYDELAESVDTIAEHIRMLGFDAPGSFNEFQPLNKITDGNAQMDAAGMIADLLDSHNIVVKILTTTLELAQKKADEVIADFMIQRLAAHRKQQWMLSSLK